MWLEFPMEKKKEQLYLRAWPWFSFVESDLLWQSFAAYSGSEEKLPLPQSVGLVTVWC